MKKTRYKSLVLLCVLVLLLTLFGCTKSDNTTEQAYQTPEEAILKCLGESGKQINSEELTNIVVDCIKIKDTNYYLLKGTQNSTAKDAIYVYLVGVTEVNDENYICEKATADFSLESIDNVEDAEYTSYSEYIIPIENIYIHVGMIFNLDYQPYFRGKKLSLDNDNVYFCTTKDAKAEVEIRKK